MSGICRGCGAALTRSFADLGLSPLANSYVPADRLDRGEVFHPLHVFVCEACFLVQVGEFESPQAIFSHYAYFSGMSQIWRDHTAAYAEAMCARFALSPDSRVVEVASNDGTLLKPFAARGLSVLGIEPAANVAAVARAAGIPTEVRFFGRVPAETLVADHGHADLMAANNVLAHVPDIHDFLAGFRVMLAPEGVATFEFPHLLRMIESCQFDTIYHEHFSYLSLGVVVGLMERAGLRVFDVEEWPTHGGSLRVFACRAEAGHMTAPSVARVLADEETAGLATFAPYDGFAARITEIREAALLFLIAARKTGKTVLGYGAAAKGNTFLNACGIRPTHLAAVADRAPSKQGTWLPGSRIPVISPEELIARRPDHVLILPWNIRDEVAGELAEVRTWGGTFVTAVPKLEFF